MSAQELYDHLAGGQTTVCRAWLVTRRDGTTLGFTDHDRDLVFDGRIFRAESGLTARAVQQTTGLAVDNTEALGALSHAAVTEEDLLAGRYDAAEVRAWLVNWPSPMIVWSSSAERWGKSCGQGAPFAPSCGG